MTTNKNTTGAVDEFTAWMDHKRRQQGTDAAYTAQWDDELWRAAWEADTALQHHKTGSEDLGFYTIRPTPALPEWLRKQVNAHVWRDNDRPAPVLFEVPSHLGDWFAWQDEHPDELTLTMSDDEPKPSTLNVDAVRRAWTLARDNDAIPLLWLGLEPTNVRGAVRARLDGLYVVTRNQNPVDVTADIDHILGFRGQPAPAPAFDTDEVLYKALWFDIPRDKELTSDDRHAPVPRRCRLGHDPRGVRRADRGRRHGRDPHRVAASSTSL